MPIARIREYGETVGKKFPALGPFKSFNPKIIGPGSGKIKAAIELAKFIARNPFIAGGVAGIATVGVLSIDNGSVPTNAGTYSYGKALRTSNKRFQSKRYAAKLRDRRSCCCR